MAGSFTNDFFADIAQTIQDATGAPATLSAATWWVVLYHTTLNDTISITDTGRMAQGSSAFTAKFTNSTATWTLVADAATSPATWQNKVTITVTTGNFSAPTQTTIKSFILASANSTAAGTVYAWGDVTPNQTVSTGNTVQFSTGTLVLTLGGATAGVAT